MKTTLKNSLLCMCVMALTAGCAASDYRPEFTPVKDSYDAKMASRLANAQHFKQAKIDARAPGSLFQAGSSGFFKDNRARQVGDLVTVIVNETAKAEVEAKTDAKRTNSSAAGVTNLLGLTNYFGKLDLKTGTGGLLDANSDRSFSGDASTEREDKLTGRIAAVVTEVLPNGYMVIQGRREIVMNYELQEMKLTGIIRPQDVAADNTVPSEKIAEARIAYAGRGIVDDSQTQQPFARFLDKYYPL